MATLIGAMATLPVAPEFKFWNRFKPKVLSAVTMAGSTGVLACCACITAGGAAVLGLLGALGGAVGPVGIEAPSIEEPPQPPSAPANINPSAALRWRKGLCCLITPPAAFNRGVCRLRILVP